MNPPLQVGVELPDADSIRARLEYLGEERKLLRKMLHLTILIEGREPLVSRKRAAQKPEVVNAR